MEFNKKRMTREEALIRLRVVKEQKKKNAERIVSRMVKEYEAQTGEKARHIEVW